MVRVEILQNCITGNNVGEIVGMDENEAKERAATKQVRILPPEPAPAMHRAVLAPSAGSAGKGK